MYFVGISNSHLMKAVKMARIRDLETPRSGPVINCLNSAVLRTVPYIIRDLDLLNSEALMIVLAEPS